MAVRPGRDSDSEYGEYTANAPPGVLTVIYGEGESVPFA